MITQPTNSSARKADLDEVSVKKDRKRGRANMPYLGYNYVAAFHWSFVRYCIQEERVWMELTRRSLINCSVYEPLVLILLDASKCSVFVKDLY